MEYRKITPEDLEGKGVIGLADTPELTARQMQEKFEQTAREVIIPRFNRLADSIRREGGPVKSRDIRALKTDREGDMLFTRNGDSWRGASRRALQKKADRESTYTKEETMRQIRRTAALKEDTFTKTETLQAISERVKEISSADMTKAEYDRDGDGAVDMANCSLALNGLAPERFSARPQKLEISFSADDWREDAGVYTQSARRRVEESDRVFARRQIPEEGGLARAIRALGDRSGIDILQAGNGLVTAFCFGQRPAGDVKIALAVIRSRSRD